MARKMTRKQKAFAKKLVENPRMNGTEAAMQTYETTRGTAAVIAHNNMKNPLVQAYLEEHSDIAQDAMLEILSNSRKFAKGGDKVGADYANVAVNVAKDIMDRVHGKATQKVEHQSTAISINIDLTGGDEEEEDFEREAIEV